MIAGKAVLTDKEVCKILQITTATMRNHLKEGKPLSKVRHFDLGRARRWSATSLNEFISGKQETRE